MESKSEIGKKGEEVALGFLKKKGLRILARNWKSKRWGELDIVARDKDSLVFVEVKTHSQDSLGKPFEAVDDYKIKSLVRAARNYKLANPQTPEAMRIDVVSVVLKSPPEIEYFVSVYEEK